MSRLVIVSNRVSAGSSKSRAGGLAVALRAALEESGGLWFGWSGRTAETVDFDPVIVRGPGFAFATVDLSKADVQGYYDGYANQTLWPLFHGRLDLAQFNHENHATYCEVNRRFAAALQPLLEVDDTVWVHDYHLIPLGAELRRLGVTAPLGFFLHIPFPASEMLAALPWNRDLIEDLCAYDQIGFQTTGCLRNFQDAVKGHPGGVENVGKPTRLAGRVPRADAFPIGIDTRAFQALAASPAVQRRVNWLGECQRGQTWIAGVDRLDYTKGLPLRFSTFEELLAQAPKLHGSISLVQVAAPSRQSVAEYQDIRTQLESLSGRINGHYGTFDWTPIRYINRLFNQMQLAALYRVSRVGLVTPLRDGMNLVAKEYVAAQDPNDPGVLVLSQFAGAAEELTDALLVNPYDTSATAEAIQRALEMSPTERRKRWENMMHLLEVNDVHRWRRTFIDALESACDLKSATSATRAA
jgi:trehalose 6-phosphate synthase